MPLTARLIIISFSSPTLFHSRLKTFFANPSHCSLIPQTFTVTSSIGCFYFLVFLLQFLVVVSVWYIKPTYVGFRAHVKIASRIVSYSAYVLDSLLEQPFSRSSLVLNPQLHTPCISSPNHHHLFAAHAHTNAACPAAISMLCHLHLVSLSAPYLGVCLLA